MDSPTKITGTENFLELEDIIARTEYLADAENADEQVEFRMLMSFLANESELIGDWQNGATLIHDAHFEDYARELAEDIGAISRIEPWPAMYIDWEAAAESLKQDYFEVELGGNTYYVRS